MGTYLRATERYLGPHTVTCHPTQPTQVNASLEKQLLYNNNNTNNNNNTISIAP